MKEEYLLTGPLERTNEPYAVAKISGIKMCQAHNRQYGTRYLCVMPTNLYGPNDNFDLETSHVLPALIRKFHLAKLAYIGDWEGVKKDEQTYGKIPSDVKESIGFGTSSPHHQTEFSGTYPSVLLWGSGNPRREFLHVDDLANACIFLSTNEEQNLHEFINSDHEPLLNIGCGEDHSVREIASIVSEVVGYKGTVKWDKRKPDGTTQKLLDISKIKKMGWEPSIELREGILGVYNWYLKEIR